MKTINLNLYISLIFYITNSLYATPVVEVVFPGLLGNRLFAFCVSKIVAEELGFKLYSRPIWGFPNTYLYENNIPSSQYPTEHIMGTGHDLQYLNIQKIVTNHRLRNIKLQGYFHKYRYLKSYTKKIRHEWLTLDPTLIQTQDPNDIVIHIRTQYDPYFLPFEYYKKALAATSYNRIFICIDEPTDPFLDNFKPYNPIICSSRSLNTFMSANMSWDEICKINLDDFAFICSFNKIIISQSTYSWWAAFLSNAQEIYAPFCSNEDAQVYGKVEESRYHYIDTPIGKSNIIKAFRQKNPDIYQAYNDLLITRLKLLFPY